MLFKRGKSEPRKLTVDSKLSALLGNPETKAVLEKHIPENINDPKLKSAARLLSLNKLFSVAGDRIDQSKLPLIEEDLKRLYI